MGGALAARLQKGLDLRVFDLDSRSVRTLAEAGSTPCESLTELASDTDVVVLCLPTSDHVREAVFGATGLAATLSPGSMIIDQTTGDPLQTQLMAAELEASDIDLIDAPVSGGREGAEAGTIAVMVGATDAQFDRARPLLDLLTSNAFHVGPVGSGHAMKLVNNLVSATQRLVALEGMTLAAKSGIDPVRARDVLAAGGARNAFIEGPLLPLVLDGNLGAGFTLGLMLKDVRLACELGEATGVPLPLGVAARDLYDHCVSERGSEDRVNSAALVLQAMAETRIVGPQSASSQVKDSKRDGKATPT
jgi:3-hydroxyisobutyrate dehydrogenase